MVSGKQLNFRGLVGRGRVCLLIRVFQ